MTFWSGEKIEQHLDVLIRTSQGHSGSPSQIDCSAFTLTMGAEAYITRNAEPTDPKGHTKLVLGEGEHFEIPAGQFAFLTTEEAVYVPVDTMAFISIKAKLKFRGLVNVSGFHVDPGWGGKLIFSVYNAGPLPVTLARCQDLFLIWYADLDRSTKFRKSSSDAKNTLSPELVSNLSGQVYSPKVLKEEIDTLRTEFIDRLDRNRTWFLGTLFVIALSGIGLLGRYLLANASSAGS